MRSRPLLATLLLVVVLRPLGALAEPPLIEAGVVTLDRWNVPAFAPLSSGEYGERVHDIDVPLRRRWATPPLVVATLSMVDSDRAANLRLQVIVLAVGTTSFRLRFRTWAETQIWGAGASWFAIEAPPGTQPPVGVGVGVGAIAPTLDPRRSQVLAPDDRRSATQKAPPPPDPKAVWRQCVRDSRFGCLPVTQGVPPQRGHDPPPVCGCIPQCSTAFTFAGSADGKWPDGSQKGNFHCATSLPP